MLPYCRGFCLRQCGLVIFCCCLLAGWRVESSDVVADFITNRSLVAFGLAGTNYTLQTSSSLSATVAWRPLLSYTLTPGLARNKPSAADVNRSQASQSPC
jgi:hypothetical protein